jgi:hypothetical protein
MDVIIAYLEQWGRTVLGSLHLLYFWPAAAAADGCAIALHTTTASAAAAAADLLFAAGGSSSPTTALWRTRLQQAGQLLVKLW